MGIGPVYAIPMVLRNTGLSAEDVDLYEVSLTTRQGMKLVCLFTFI